MADGRLCLASLAEISKVITPANAAEVLPRFFHRSSREAKEVVAEIAPHPAPPRREIVTVVRPSASTVDSPAVVRSQVDPSPVRVQAHGQIELDRPESAMSLSSSLAETPASAPPPATEPTSSADALESTPPDAADATRSGTPVTGESATPAGTRKRHRKAVPAHVRREVLIRDEQKCQAKLHDGTICGSKVRLQFDHVVPDSLGGPTTIENGRVLCASHNQLVASKVFGEQIMDVFGRRRS